MAVDKSTGLRLLAVLLLGAFHLGSPEPAYARGQCNLFCWTDCNTLQGSWCGSGCGGPGLLCMPAGVCHEFDDDLVTVTCYAYDE